MNYSALKNLIQEHSSMNAFAKSLGVSESGFLKMFGRGDMKVSMLERCCELLGVSPCRFFEGSPVNQINEPQAPYSAPADAGKLVELYEENRKLHNIIHELQGVGPSNQSG